MSDPPWVMEKSTPTELSDVSAARAGLCGDPAGILLLGSNSRDLHSEGPRLWRQVVALDCPVTDAHGEKSGDVLQWKAGQAQPLLEWAELADQDPAELIGG